MEPELTPRQARDIAELRTRHPGADLRVHEKPWGVIVEVRRLGRALELRRFDWSGRSVADQVVA